MRAATLSGVAEILSSVGPVASSRCSRSRMAIVPENRRLFGPMTVLENLQMGAYLTGGGTEEDYERVYTLFPLLYERRSQLAGWCPPCSWPGAWPTRWRSPSSW